MQHTMREARIESLKAAPGSEPAWHFGGFLPGRLELDGGVEAERAWVAELLGETLDAQEIETWQSPSLGFGAPRLGRGLRVGEPAGGRQRRPAYRNGRCTGCQ